MAELPHVKASSHKIVKQLQTIGDGSGKLNLVQIIDTDCSRQSVITTSLCEHDRRLFADPLQKFHMNMFQNHM